MIFQIDEKISLVKSKFFGLEAAQLRFSLLKKLMHNIGSKKDDG